jgi:arylsulfatase A-like enzyme
MENSFRSLAIRRNNWKYIDEKPQLYDLSKDPGETENLLNKFPEIAKDMKNLLEKYNKQSLGSR